MAQLVENLSQIERAGEALSSDCPVVSVHSTPLCRQAQSGAGRESARSFGAGLNSRDIDGSGAARSGRVTRLRAPSASALARAVSVAFLSLMIASNVAAAEELALSDQNVGDEAEGSDDDALAQQAPETEAAATVEVDEEALEEVEESEPFELPVDVSAGVSIISSLGSWTRDNFGTRDSVSSSWSFGVSRDFTDRLTGSVGFGFSWCLNDNCGLVNPGEARFRDISVDLDYGSFYVIPRAQIELSTGISGLIPTSRISRTQNLYTTLGTYVAMSRSFGNFSLSYRFSVSKSFNQFKVVVQDADDSFDRDVLVREGGAENVGSNQVAEGTGYLTEWSLSNSLNAGYRLKNVSLSLGFSLGESFTYRIPDAENVVTDDGNEINTITDGRRGRSQLMTGSIGMRYTLPVWEDRVSLSGTMSTTQTPKTADGRRIRFPFFDTQSANLSATSMIFGLSMRY